MSRFKLLARIAGLISLITLAASPVAPALAGDNEWTPTGGPPGLVYAIALDPVNPGVVYAGTSSAGVFKSTDGGQHWATSGQELASSAILSLAIDPVISSTVYAGTNRGVYRSNDAGLTWAEMSKGLSKDPFGNAFIYTLQVARNRPSTIYAGTLRGIFKSEDGGETWQEKSTGLRVAILPAVEALAVDPQDADTLYAGAAYQGLSGTLFKSEDGGSSWVPLTVGFSRGTVSSITVDPSDPQKVFAATRSEGVFVSGDGGRTWTAAGQGLPVGNYAAVSAGGSPPVVYAAGARNGFYRSLDGGLTWELAEAEISNRGPISMAVDHRSSSTVWLTSFGGLYSSTDRGSHWAGSGQGLAGSQIVNVVTHPADANTAYVSAWASGVYLTRDGGTTWQEAPLGVGIGSSLALDPVDNGLVYAGMVYISGIKDTGLYVSRDAGVSWEILSQFKGSTIAAIATAPGKAYLATNAGVYISDDSGATWRQSNSGLPSSGQVLDIVIHPRTQSRLYLTLEFAPQDLYWSEDGGQTWKLLRRFDRAITSLVPSMADPDLLYAATNASVWRTEDGGTTWQEIPFSGAGTILSLSAHPVASDTLYIGSSQGAYRSVDAGRAWTLLGLENEAVAAMAVSRADATRVYGGTFGKGVWSYRAVPALRVLPGALTFMAEPGGASPRPASMSVQDAGGGSYGWTVQTPSWLSVSPSSGSSLPVTLTASLNQTGLSAGSYEGTITVVSAMTNTTNSPFPVTARLLFGPLSRQYMPQVSKGTSGW